MPQVIDYAIQIAGALVAAHEGGIVHRDLKPTNIMVTANGSVKLLDFGTARAPDRAGIQSSLAGTLPYMAPEQLRSAGASAQSDIFSFGCVLYEMVIGRRAFPQASTAAVLASILCEEPAPLRMGSSAASRDLQQLIAACMHKAPEERLQNMRQAFESLREIRDRIVPLPPAQQRRYRLNQVLAAAACATTVWLMVSSWQTRQAAPTGDLKPVPLTTYPGSEESGSFSPDGKQVAFTWDGEEEDNADVYVKPVHTEAPRRLTTDPAPDLMPAWSPDGRQIAFIRRRRGSIDILTQSPRRGKRDHSRPLDLQSCLPSISFVVPGFELAGFPRSRRSQVALRHVSAFLTRPFAPAVDMAESNRAPISLLPFRATANVSHSAADLSTAVTATSSFWTSLAGMCLRGSPCN